MLSPAPLLHPSRPVRFSQDHGALQDPPAAQDPIVDRCRALDRRLRAEACIGVRIDRALGRALDLLRRRKLYRVLSFVRFSDYAREAVRLSGRTAQEMIRTERALAGLPGIASARDLGILQAEHVRLLCRVATTETEREWTLRACELSVRRLAQEVRRVSARDEGDRGGAERPPGSEGETEGGGGDTARHDSDGGDDLPRQRISFRAPVTVALRWRMALELSAAVSGAELPEWALVENLCAECRSGLPLSWDDHSYAFPEGAALDEAEPDVVLPSPSERLDPADCGGEENGADDLDDSDDIVGDRSDSGRVARCDRRRAPPSLEQFLDAEAPEDPWALHERIGALAEMRRRIDAGLSRRLFDFWTSGGTLHAGYRSLGGYAREVLGMSERRARELLGVVRFERRLPSPSLAGRDGSSVGKPRSI